MFGDQKQSNFFSQSEQRREQSKLDANLKHT